MQGQLKGANEDNVLTLCCWNEDHAAEVAVQVPPELYSTRVYQDIARVAHDYIAKYNKPPRAHLRDLMEMDLRRAESGTFLGRVLESMEALQGELQPAYVLSELDRFIQIQRLTQAVSEASDALHSGNLEDAQARLYTPDLTPKAEPGAWLNETDSWLSFLDEDETELFSSGIGVLDDHGVRPARGEMFLVIAAAKVGKSWNLIQIGRDNLLRGKNVLHITLENSLKITKERYTMTLLALSQREAKTIRVPLFKTDAFGHLTSAIDFDQVMPQMMKSLSRNELRRRLLPFQRRGRLLVKWYPTGSLTTAGLLAYLTSLGQTQNFKPDIVILDYADLMSIDARDLRIATGRLFRDLRGLAGLRDFALVTATQGNRYSADAKVVSTTHVAEDWSKIGTADTVVTISRTLDEKAMNLARILVAAARNAEDSWKALISQSYATGQFCLDSCYFDKLSEEELQKLTGKEDDE